jgi:hypothetical protein
VIDDSRVYHPLALYHLVQGWPPPKTGGEIVHDAQPRGNPRAGDQNGSIRLPLNLRCKSKISRTGATYFLILGHCEAPLCHQQCHNLKGLWLAYPPGRMLKNLCKRCHSERSEESLSGTKGLARFLVVPQGGTPRNDRPSRFFSILLDGKRAKLTNVAQAEIPRNGARVLEADLWAGVVSE